MLRALIDVPIGLIAATNAALMFVAWAVQNFVLEEVTRYPPALQLVAVGLMAYLPYHCIVRGETLFARDEGGAKSRVIFYGIAYLFLVVFLLLDVGLALRVLERR